MSVRNLDALFRPASIALIGASRKPRSVGQVLAHNLFNAGFEGPIMPVHPRERAIEAVYTYQSVEQLPVVPDLAVIATPPPTIPGLIDELGSRGTRAAVVISAGFAELGAEGRALQQQVLDAARPYTLRVVGPNCIGVIVPGHGLNASFAQTSPTNGRLAFVSQSGAVLTGVLDWASARGIGFSRMVSLGGMADVDFGDLLDDLATDRATSAVLLYVEAVSHARKFMSAARACARAKPVIVIKGGRTQEAAKAASSHTGALAGSDAVYDAAFCRAGMLRVESLDELFAAVETLSSGLKVAGQRMAILSNGGGIGVLATDALIAGGGELATLSEATMARLDAVLPPVWSRGNPVDIIGDASGERYAAALTPLLQDPNNDAVLVLNCPTAIGATTEAADATVLAASQHRRPVLTSWLGEDSAVPARRRFAAARIPTYDTPTEAVRAFMHLVHYQQNQEMLRQVPPSAPADFEPDVLAAERVIDRALTDGRDWLTEPEAKDVLEAYRIRTVPTRIVHAPDEAARAAEAFDGACVIKILSPDITHKSDVGGVMLGLADPWRVHEAARTMLDNIRTARPDARIDGLTVQPMVDGRHAFELIVGMHDDSLFGPVLLFGEGGTAVEVVRDQALALAPLNLALAWPMMRATRIFKRLEGYRDRPPAALDELALTLVKVSQLVTDLDRVAELDINPLLVDAEQVLALDARIRIARPARRGTTRLAIRPYPQELEQSIEIAGRRLLVRPVRPEDAPALRRMVDERTTAEDKRLRFFTTFKTLAPELCARLTQIDYDREMALVAVDPGVAPEEGFCGVVRIAADPDRLRAEYAVLVRSDLKGQGLGTALMHAIIAYATGQGIGELVGSVLRENETMLDIAERLGFSKERDPGDAEVVHVRLPLIRNAA
ncbi:MAG: bifunctional acetate--CoA ligase family protein/GNAT family N-acetyltransferase [Geminicoccaceae bacterium]|nr:bifunctional acetate--CoA ligase family protein/GNAT family N-acetyltransferase [Geminicoccaceae bacterium]